MTDTVQNAEPQIATDDDTKVQHLVLIVSECGRGNDIIEIPGAEGGLRLNEDEDDVIDLAVLIEEEIVPLFYQGEWGRFLIDLLCVVKNAKEDGTGDVLDDIRYFLNSLHEEGIVRVG